MSGRAAVATAPPPDAPQDDGVGGHLQGMAKELTCPLCAEPFRNPHRFAKTCGHCFCYECVIATLEGPGIAASQCPACRVPAWKNDLVADHMVANLTAGFLALAAAARREGHPPLAAAAPPPPAAAASKRRRVSGGAAAAAAAAAPSPGPSAAAAGEPDAGAWRCFGAAWQEAQLAAGTPRAEDVSRLRHEVALLEAALELCDALPMRPAPGSGDKRPRDEGEPAAEAQQQQQQQHEAGAEVPALGEAAATDDDAAAGGPAAKPAAKPRRAARGRGGKRRRPPKKPAAPAEASEAEEDAAAQEQPEQEEEQQQPEPDLEPEQARPQPSPSAADAGPAAPPPPPPPPRPSSPPPSPPPQEEEQQRRRPAAPQPQHQPPPPRGDPYEFPGSDADTGSGLPAAALAPTARAARAAAAPAPPARGGGRKLLPQSGPLGTQGAAGLLAMMAAAGVRPAAAAPPAPPAAVRFVLSGRLPAGGDEQATLAAAAALPGFSLAPDVAPDTTHVVVATDAAGLAERRTAKYLCGVAAGAWVVSHAWLDACVAAGGWVPEAAYEVAGVAGLPDSRGGAAAARRRREAGRPGLLAGRVFHVHLAGADARVLRGLVERLLRATGAAVADSAAAARDGVLTDCADALKAAAGRGQLATGLRWVLDSVAAGRLLDRAKYM